MRARVVMPLLRRVKMCDGGYPKRREGGALYRDNLSNGRKKSKSWGNSMMHESAT